MKAGLRNDLPATRIRDTDYPRTNIRNDSLVAHAFGDVPTVRVGFGAILSAETTTNVYAGTPIGLLLALTYVSDLVVTTAATFKGFSPTAGIRNTD